MNSSYRLMWFCNVVLKIDTVVGMPLYNSISLNNAKQVF